MKSDALKFIDQIKNSALKVQARTGIPAAVIIAQACLESGFGKRICTDVNTKKNSKNLFGIKGTGPAGSVLCWTTEYYNGKKQRVLAGFRAYNSFEESFTDHAQLLQKPRYAPCMAVKNNPREFAQRLQQCGYATDPKYGSKLTNLMTYFKLDALTLPADPASPEKPAHEQQQIIEIPIIVNGTGYQGLLLKGVSYAPVRAVFESLGYRVTWDQATKTVTVNKPL